MAGKSPLREPISPVHQCSSERFVTVMTSPLRKSSSPLSCAVKSYKACTKLSSGTMSRSLTSCERDTEAVRWYSTSSLRELNLTTHKKNLPWLSRRTLKCWTPSEHFTESEKSPGLDSLMRMRNAPSCLLDKSFSASAVTNSS